MWPSPSNNPSYATHLHGSDMYLHGGSTLGVGVGIFPLIATPIPTTTTAIATTTATTTDSRMNMWQNQANTYIQGSIEGGSGTATCQDCGNQSKKDCRHRRCRTCCKSRGFDCSTHVKSTWVPAARRRERLTIGAAGSSNSAGCSSGSTSGAKKPRLYNTATSRTSTSNTPPRRSFESASTHQDGNLKENLPGQVRAPAVFKCVRVTAVDDGEDEFAYQAVVKIGGHIFKGFLYDQGLDHQDQDQDQDQDQSQDHPNNVAGSIFSNMSELHLGNSRIIRDNSARHILDPRLLATSSAFGNQINLS